MFNLNTKIYLFFIKKMKIFNSKIKNNKLIN